MKKEVICGVYCIQNLIDGKRYIGSSENIYYRWYQHRTELKKNKHCNQKLQEAWNEYGEKSFEFSIIEECLPKDRFIYEQKWYDYYVSYDSDFGYNGSRNAESPVISFGIDDIKQGKSILSLEKFYELMDLLSNTYMSFHQIAEKLKLSVGYVFSVYSRKILMRATEGYEFNSRSGIKKSILMSDDVKIIIKRLLNLDCPVDIAKDFGVNVNTIYDIRNHKSWTELTEGIIFDKKGVERKYATKAVVQYDFNGNVISEYISAREAYNITGVSYKNISAVCRGSKKSAEGFVWRFVGDPFDLYDVSNLYKRGKRIKK